MAASPPPFSVDAALQDAIAHHQAGRLPQAEQAYRDILLRQPQQVDANHNLGILAGQIGQPALGLPHLKLAAETAPDLPQYTLSYANALSQTGRMREAEAVLRAAVGRGLSSAELYNNLGNLYRELGQPEQAEASLRQAIVLKPDFAAAHYNLGSSLQQDGKLSEAASSFRRALEVDPGLAPAHNNLGVVHSSLGEHDAALTSFQRAIAIAPDYAEAYFNRGNALRDLGRMDDAVADYRQALAIRPAYAEAQGNLGNVLRDLGQLEDAAHAYEAAVAAKPDLIEAHYELSALKTSQPDDPRLAMLEQQRAHTLAWPMERQVQYWFALGKIYEDVGQYDASFAAYREGNRLQQIVLPHDDAAEEALLTRMLQFFSADFLAMRGRASPVGPTPIFIVGMPRSGTSLLEQVLASYPGIYGAGELTALSEAVTAALPGHDFGLFPEALASLAPQDWENMGAHYLQKARAHAPNASHIVDKMPANFFYIGVIRLMLPQAKIIHAQRDPLDTCFSCYARLFGKDRLSFSYDLQALGRYYLRYAKMMRHWNRVLPAGALLDMHYEDMVADTEAQARRLLAYLELPWDARCLDFHQNQRRVSTASAAQVRKPIYRSSVARWQRFEKHLAPLLEILGQR